MTNFRAFFRSVSLGLVSCLWAAASACPARADTYYDFVRITCAPEISYFSIRRFQLFNLPRDLFDRDGKPPSAIVAAGIYTVIQLKKAPGECNLAVGSGDQKRRMQLRIVGFYEDQNGQATSYRHIVTNVEVLADGKLLGRLFLNPYGFSLAGIDLMEIFADGGEISARTCSFYEATEQQGKKGCTTRRL